MMNRAQTIQLFLADGTPNGIWVAEIMGKTLRAIVVPRINLKTIAERPESRKTGVYVLVGTTPDNPLQQTIYIGQSENVWNRLKQHDPEEKNDFWERTIIFTSTDANLTKSHVLYLESRLISLALQSGRANLKNDVVPKKPSLPESHEAFMEEYLDWIRLLLPVLGYNFAVSIPDETVNDKYNDNYSISEAPSLQLTMDKVGVAAKLHEINGEWIIIAGSTMRKEIRDSLPESLVRLRSSLLSNGTIVESDSHYWKFTKNYPATSLSMAASLIAGVPYSGTGAWIVESTNEPYWQWRQRQLDETESTLVQDDD